jgi:hypothetical protein
VAQTKLSSKRGNLPSLYVLEMTYQGDSLPNKVMSVPGKQLIQINHYDYLGVQGAIVEDRAFYKLAKHPA